ncbi:uncharacterized protein TRUGW13939_06510 [Talaromyces rugulosus]|uniref:Uncharacterized protein n=1 Tax=Talaromyces rugulosus TaxID=121627 RepID=A0A7H8R041_TALRU|nr:uncharacterized protein TRUGW13939_06510 [Talaromyces rugulosus]QKX59376.1 hypothetical protein TRUGW13939_06510 [Talaromyces rugulosus]
MHFPSVTLLAGSLLMFSGTSLGGSILAFAPITALSGQYALEARHIGGACPAASQTSCSDGIGCCPSGAACTYSGELPVCDELCGAGPKCSNGGCCQAGYFCGVTNNFCTPSPTGIAKMPTFSWPVDAPFTTPTATIITSSSGPEDPSSQDISSPGSTVRRPTATSTSTQSALTGGGLGTSGSSHTPSNTAGRSRTSTSTKSTTTRTGAAGGGAVAKTTSSRHSPTPSSTGAASSLDPVSGLAAMGFGWIAGFLAIL